jgi:hypothetical protein
LKPHFRRTECTNCGRLREPEQLDRQRWCKSCRQNVIQRAARWSRGIALVFTLGVGIWIAAAIRPTRFLIVWMAILAATYMVVYKIAQRVAFELIRTRSVPPTEDDDE